jgi:hypothetical protein
MTAKQIEIMAYFRDRTGSQVQARDGEWVTSSDVHRALGGKRPAVETQLRSLASVGVLAIALPTLEQTEFRFRLRTVMECITEAGLLIEAARVLSTPVEPGP